VAPQASPRGDPPEGGRFFLTPTGFSPPFSRGTPGSQTFCGGRPSPKIVFPARISPSGAPSYKNSQPPNLFLKKLPNFPGGKPPQKRAKGPPTGGDPPFLEGPKIFPHPPALKRFPQGPPGGYPKGD